MQRRGDVVVIDGEVSNSTHTDEAIKKTPERYFEAYIAEQMMMATAIGFQVRGWTPFAATFAAFHSRSYDFVRMAVISQAKLCLNGSHAGVSIGDGAPANAGAGVRGRWPRDRRGATARKAAKVAAGPRSPRPSPPSTRGRTTSCAWR